MQHLPYLFLFLLHLSLMSAAEQAYPRTEVGCMEIKTLPAATLIASRSEAKYFDRNNGLFMPLFRYIQSNDIAMTTPVESEISPGVMYFHIGNTTASERLKNTPSVSIHLMAERAVASIGLRGSYSAENFKNGEQQLAAWLATQPNYQRAGAARGVFWNGPFMPALFKRFEVHIPVAKVVVTAP
jgi:hypothetical protein